MSVIFVILSQHKELIPEVKETWPEETQLSATPNGRKLLFFHLYSGAPAAEGRHAELHHIEPMHSFSYGHLRQR